MPDERPDESSAPRFGRRPRQGAATPAPAGEGAKPTKPRIGPRRVDAPTPSVPPPPAPPPAADTRSSRGGVRKPKTPASPPTQAVGQNVAASRENRPKGGIRRKKDKNRPQRTDGRPSRPRQQPPPAPSAPEGPGQLDIFETREGPDAEAGAATGSSGGEGGSTRAHGDSASGAVGPDSGRFESGLSGLSRNARRRKRRKDRRQQGGGSAPEGMDAFEPAIPMDMEVPDDVSFEEDESDFHVSEMPPPSRGSSAFLESSFPDTSFAGTEAEADDDGEEGETSSDLPVEGGPPPSGQQRESRSKRRRKKRRERNEPAPVDRASGYWWAEQWMRSFEVLYSGGASRARLQKGRSYARRGQVTELEVGPNGVLARVQGSRPKPYQVRLELNRLRRETWGRILHQLAGKAAFLAQLLEGTLPPEIEDVFFAAGARLFPHGDNDVRSRCTCPDPVVPCKHVASVHYVLADALQRDPFLLFALRGKSRDQFLQDLREQRGREGGRRESSPPPAEDLAQFWRMGRLAESVLRPTGWGSGGDPARLIQSLGEPQLDGIREGLFLPLLESTYRQVSEGMRRLPKDG